MAKRAAKTKRPHNPPYMASRDEDVITSIGVPIRHQIWDLTLFQGAIEVVGNVDPTLPLIVYGKTAPASFGAYDIAFYLSSQKGYSWNPINATATTKPGFQFTATFGPEYELGRWDTHYIITAYRTTPRGSQTAIEFDV